MLRRTAKLTLSRNFISPSFDAKKNPFRGNIPTINASISTEGISLVFFSGKGKNFAHDRRPLSEPHHRLTYFQYTGAISERNMDRRLHNGEMALRKWDGG